MTSTRYEDIENQKRRVRRHATSKGLSFGPLATVITIGTVAVLLGVTFIGDWLRTPKVSAEVSPSIISPNNDRAQDSTNFSYTLNEDATVAISVYNDSNNLVKSLAVDQFQTRGQHVIAWDGTDSFGEVVADGRYRLEVSARGTVLATNQSATVLVDTQPPTLRLANMDELSRVRDANLTVDGLTDPDAVIQVAGEPQILPVNSEGRFSIKRQLNEGSNIIQVSATDPAGNTSQVSREVILVTRPPEIVLTEPANDLWTNESLMTVSGVVPVGSSLKVNGQEASIGENGQFKREVILQEGDNTLRLEATDDVGNITSQEVIVHRKTTPPQLTLNLEDGTTFQQPEIQVTGKTEPGATVTIGGRAIAVSSLGEFQTSLNLATGANLLEVTAQDQAGNVTRAKRQLRFEVTPPESELARVARNLPNLSTYLVPVLVSLPLLLILAYMLTRPVALVLSAESSNFRPGLPEEGRFLRMAIDLSKPARTTVEIKDRRGNTLATLLYRRHRGAGQHMLYWDGYDDFGRVVLPGDYVVEAAASTPGGAVTGNLIITVLEDRAVHRQYLRQAPSYQDEAEISNQPTELAATTRRARRR